MKQTNQEQLCTYRQASILKHLGFNKPCYRYYIKKQLSHNIQFRNHNDTGIATSAPTLTFAAQWLRETMGADLVVSPRFNSKTGERIGYFWRWAQRTDVIDEKTYKSHDRALSAGISKILEPFKEYFNENH